MENAIQQERTTQLPRDLYQHVTDTIISQLEAGAAPWQQPWQGESPCLSLPFNYATGNKYQGINILLLWIATFNKSFQSSEWASFKQWQKKGEAIRKGEKGTLIVYYDTFEKEIDDEIKKIPFLKSSIVFNRSQLNSYSKQSQPVEQQPDWQSLNPIEKFIDNTQAIIKNHQGGAFYSKLDDHIMMPYPSSFIETANCTALQGYYSTTMHELTHWTGHTARLNRQFGKKFGDRVYAAEELLAELGAAFLCAELGLPIYETGHNANYIAAWLKALKNDKRFIFSAASEASKAVSYLKSLQIK